MRTEPSHLPTPTENDVQQTEQPNLGRQPFFLCSAASTTGLEVPERKNKSGKCPRGDLAVLSIARAGR